MHVLCLQDPHEYELEFFNLLTFMADFSGTISFSYPTYVIAQVCLIVVMKM
jgi:hypothetical protein